VSLRDLLVVSLIIFGLFCLAGAVLLYVIELRLKHLFGRLGSIGESLDSLNVSLRGKVESLDGKVTETARELYRQAERIGELVMRELKKLDKVAYIRFASVYRNFEDVDAFSKAIREVSPTPRKK